MAKPTQVHRSLTVVLALGSTQTIAWASSYYLPAIVAQPMSREFGVSPVTIFAAVSISILLSGLVGPAIGKRIDRFGGREVLAASNIVFAAGLFGLAAASNLISLALAWLLLGLGMGIGLYDAAFATLGRLYGHGARRSITGISLMAGFASTIGWPLTSFGVDAIGWRMTCVAWALVHLLAALPINLAFVPKVEVAMTPAEQEPHEPIEMDRNMWLLGFAFAGIWFVATAMAVHLPRLFEILGATPGEAVAASALIGPAQVAGRIFEASYLSRFHPIFSARLAATAHPIAIVLLAIGGAAVAPVFAFVHGCGNGTLTIARGTVPLAIYGPRSYGYRLGLLSAPGRLSQAAAPLAFGLLVEHSGLFAVAVSGLIGAATFAAFALVAPPLTNAVAARQ